MLWEFKLRGREATESDRWGTMPKNTNNSSAIIPKSKPKPISTARRKPLLDVSNAVITSSKSTAKKLSHNYYQQEEEQQGEDNAALDRLLLIHSNIFSLTRQIDELVAQALKFPSENGMKEIESFANVLSEMQTSLKQWVPRFQKVLSSGPVNQLEESMTSREFASKKKDTSHVVESPEQSKWDSLISPSPLVSWRAGCTTEGGRQLFLLTPLPRPKAFSAKCQEQSESVLEKTTLSTMVQPPAIFDVAGETNDDLLEGIVIKQTLSKVSDGILKSRCSSPENLWRRESSMLLMTPCLKISPPKSCVLLEPVPEFRQKVSHGVYKSTPYPDRVQISEGSQDSESSSSQSLEEISIKYPELLGIKLGNNYGNRSKMVEESPYRLMSPPKSCAFMEPPDDKLLTNAPSDYPLPEVGSTLDQGANQFPVKENDLQGSHFLDNITCKQEVGSSLRKVESTPMLSVPGSTTRFGKRPGENTLKKELWAKFEAASISGIGFNVSNLQQNAQNGFLDRLDEVS